MTAFLYQRSLIMRCVPPPCTSLATQRMLAEGRVRSQESGGDADRWLQRARLALGAQAHSFAAPGPERLASGLRNASGYGTCSHRAILKGVLWFPGPDLKRSPEQLCSPRSS